MVGPFGIVVNDVIGQLFPKDPFAVNCLQVGINKLIL